jgi:hypothetical protein
LMVSQSANDLSLSLLVNSGDHATLLESAHRVLIPAGEEKPGSVFGASWKQIQPIAN